MTTQKEAQTRVNAIKTEIDKLVTEAEKLCDETGASFSLNIAYGMGGSYIPSLKNVDAWTEQARDEHEVYRDEDSAEWSREGYYDIDEDGGWYTSSMSC